MRYRLIGPPIEIGRFNLLGNAVSCLKESGTSLEVMLVRTLTPWVEYANKSGLNNLEVYWNNPLLGGEPLPIRERKYYRKINIPKTFLIGMICERLVFGACGEVLYTADHYKSFVWITQQES